jgi:hypothetical protein
MVSVCIFVLRDVIRKMQQEFQTPFNSFTHSSPSTEKDIKSLCDYLEAQHLQTYDPQRENNTNASEARDLIQTGSDYVDTPSAFRNFKYTKFNITNHGLLEAAATAATQSTDINADVDDIEDLQVEDDYSSCELDSNEAVGFEDLLLDEDEFPLGSDVGDYIATIHEVIDELSHYE